MCQKSHEIYYLGTPSGSVEWFCHLSLMTMILKLSFLQGSAKQKINVSQGEENMLVYNCSDVTMQTSTYASLASNNRNKPIRESFI